MLVRLERVVMDTLNNVIPFAARLEARSEAESIRVEVFYPEINGSGPHVMNLHIMEDAIAMFTNTSPVQQLAMQVRLGKYVEAQLRAFPIPETLGATSIEWTIMAASIMEDQTDSLTTSES